MSKLQMKTVNDEGLSNLDEKNQSLRITNNQLKISTSQPDCDTSTDNDIDEHDVLFGESKRQPTKYLIKTQPN